MAEIHHEIKVRATQAQIRKALTTIAELEAWHGGRVTMTGNAVRFEFADGAPSFCWAIEAEKSGKGLEAAARPLFGRALVPLRVP